MAVPLNHDIREKMFALYAEGQTFNHISRTLHVCAPTLRKYRELDKWEERRQKVRDLVAKKTNNEYATRQTRHVMQAQLLQARGSERLREPKSLKREDMAIAAITQGIRLEREIMGDDAGVATEPVTINIQLVAARPERPITRGETIVESEEC